MNKRTVHDFDVAGEKIFLRVDFIEPLHETLESTDDLVAVASLPTIHPCVRKVHRYF